MAVLTLCRDAKFASPAVGRLGLELFCRRNVLPPLKPASRDYLRIIRR
jgi:hypothetical protein